MLPHPWATWLALMNQETLVDHGGTCLYPQYGLCEIAAIALGSLALILVNDGMKEAKY